MADATQQTFDNHVRRMPGYVNALFLIFLANILWTAFKVVTMFSVDAAVAFLVAISLPWLAVVSRQQALSVQNRVIRLEERLRYRSVLPPDVASRASGLPIDQLVALRFASDAELPELVNDVLAGKLTAPKDIKRRVKEWQADHLRA